MLAIFMACWIALAGSGRAGREIGRESDGANGRMVDDTDGL
jgi:hypothetical protein